MYAVFVVTEIDASKVEEVDTMLKEGLAPRIKQSPGFVSGTWGRSADGTEGRSMVLFKSEEDARAALDRLMGDAPSSVQ